MAACAVADGRARARRNVSLGQDDRLRASKCSMSARAALSRLVLPCIDKEGDDGLFAKRFGGL
jgi:hypothetical protein